MKDILVVANSKSFIYPYVANDIQVFNLFKRFYTNRLFSKIHKFVSIVFIKLGLGKLVLGEWFKNCYDDRTRIVFLDECGLTSDIIKIINRKPDNKAIYLWNISSKVSHFELILKKAKCRVFSFDYCDSKKYGLRQLDSIIPKLKLCREETDKDIFFYGQDKGRREIISKLKDGLQNIQCDFTVLDDKKMNYSQPLEYSEYLERAQKSRALLEVLQEGQTGETIRTVESAILKRRLVTNNANAKRLHVLEENVFVFEKIEDIDFDALTKFVKSDYVNADSIDREVYTRYPKAWFNLIFSK